jgi:hypothetical protein
MSVLIPLAALVLFVGGAIAWSIRDHARGQALRDDTLRAGEPGHDAHIAARHAQGTAAWVRMSDSAGL